MKEDICCCNGSLCLHYWEEVEGGEGVLKNERLQIFGEFRVGESEDETELFAG